MSVVEEAAMSSVSDRFDNGQEFLYRPIPILIPISMGFVFLSLAAAMMPELLVVPLVGAGLGLLALRQIRRSQGNFSGAGLAWGCLIAQGLMGVAFALLHTYSYATEVPPGFERVNFTADIANKGFVNFNGMMGIHPDVQKLVDQKVMIKGYMYPTKTIDGLTSFVLCRDSGACCFGGQPKTTDMILVHMNGDNAVRYRTGLVAVAGVFRAEPTIDETGLQPVYQLNCDHFGPAKTWY